MSSVKPWGYDLSEGGKDFFCNLLSLLKSINNLAISYIIYIVYMSESHKIDSAIFVYRPNVVKIPKS